MINRIYLLGAAGLMVAGIGCEIDDPCDPGQLYENANCVDPEVEMMEEDMMMDDSMIVPDAGLMTLSTENEPLETGFGDMCADPEGSSDCGGTAPVCLPMLNVCSQILCLEGEANQGVCPMTWICFTPPDSPASVCLDPAVLAG